jgi:hypothetical protein
LYFSQKSDSQDAHEKCKRTHYQNTNGWIDEHGKEKDSNDKYPIFLNVFHRSQKQLQFSCLVSISQKLWLLIAGNVEGLLLCWYFIIVSLATKAD